MQALTDDHKALSDYGYTSTVAKAQSPATIGLVFKTEGKNQISLIINL